MANQENAKTLRITLIRSTTGFTERHRLTVRALGLRHIRQTVELADSPSLRGMLYKVARLVKVEEA